MNKEWVFNVLNDIGVSNILRNRKRKKLTVLSLHRVSPETDYFWDPIKPNTFELLLKYLRKYYTIISFSDIDSITDPALSEKPYLILSFDDGYYDFYEYALPLLVKYDISSNHNIVNECAENNYVIWTQRMNTIFTHCRKNDITLNFQHSNGVQKFSDHHSNWMEFYLYMYRWMLGQTNSERNFIIEQKENELSISTQARMMNWEQVKECASNKVEIGSHSYSHDVLSTISDPAVLTKEIVSSTKELEHRLQKKVSVLALPNSEANHDIKRYATEAGLRYILFVDNNLNGWTHVKKPGVVYVDRLNLVEEPISSMILRAESLHAKLRQYV
ncbi:MAG: polysaccharide deacetylase family protein [Ferruginibacter sp.]